MRRNEPRGAEPAPGSVRAGAAGAGARRPELPRVGDLVLGGKYRIDEPLGRGGMGVVMAAEHITLGQKVAFKFLKPGEADADATERFVREARAAARIDNEHVVRVNDVGVLESGVAYMLMERLEGEDLNECLRRRGPLPIDEAVLYLVQACDAAAAAHAAGVIHRDLKPANLFLARRRDGRCAVKVLDFGISKASEWARGELERSLTRPGTVLGSPRYMSPEQVRDRQGVDARADIWALGAVLHELLTGSPLYEGDTFQALCAIIVAAPPAPLRAKRPDAPAGLEAIVLRCAQKDSSDRFASVAELALALAPYGPPEAARLAERAARRLGAGPAPNRASPRPPAGGADAIAGGPSAPAAVLSAAQSLASRRARLFAFTFALSATGLAAMTALLLQPGVAGGPAPAPGLAPADAAAGAPALGAAAASLASALPFVSPAARAPPVVAPFEGAPALVSASASPVIAPVDGPSPVVPPTAGASSAAAGVGPRRPPRRAGPASDLDDGALLNRR